LRACSGKKPAQFQADLVRNALDRTDIADSAFACSRILYSYQVYGIERLQQCQPAVAEVLVAIEHGAKRLNHAR